MGSVLSLTLGILNEADEVERRVALVPDSVLKLKGMGFRILLESGSGEASFFTDDEYSGSGAVLSSREEVIANSQIIAVVGPPSVETASKFGEHSVLIGLLLPAKNEGLIRKLANRNVTSFSLDLLPRISRAQQMDVLSSQASVAGYHAAIEAALVAPVLFPMLTTAAGTVRPAKVLVIGAGVAGLMAIATSRRLGASVSAFDVRKSAGEDVRSLGAKFLETGIDASGAGGYARDLSLEEEQTQKSILEEALAQSDVVITAASVPGKKAPKILTKGMVESMRAGSVIVDVAAESGGNCEFTIPGETVVHRMVTISGQTNLPALTPQTASGMFSRNIASFIELLTGAGKGIPEDFGDEVLKSCLVTQSGKIVYQYAHERSGEK